MMAVLAYRVKKQLPIFTDAKSFSPTFSDVHTPATVRMFSTRVSSKLGCFMHK